LSAGPFREPPLRFFRHHLQIIGTEQQSGVRVIAVAAARAIPLE
jgi:hypothetical protein